MNAADPMDDQNDLSRLRIDIGDHLMNDGADDPLLQPRIGRRGGPDGLEVCRERGERSRIDNGRDRSGVIGGDLAFNLCHPHECLVPAHFQFAGHQPIGRVGGVVLSEGAIGGIARRFEITLECFAHLITSLAGFFLSSNGRRGGASADHCKKRLINGIIDPQTAKGDATRLAIVHPAAAAAVAGDVVLCARIAERQLAPAAVAAEQARQQSVAMLGRAMMAARGNIAAHHLADRLGFLPADIALMGVRHQCQPIAAHLAASLYADARTIIARRHGRLTISVGTAVDRVLDHSVDGGVVWAPPDRLALLALRRQIEIVLVEPEQSLPGAAEFQDFVEDQADGLLHAPVRVLLIAIAGLHEPHGSADNEFAAARLLVSGRERTLPQQIELVLVETALKAEQKPIIAVAGRIDRLLIDQHRVHHTAHLDQLLPIPAVASKARDLSRCHGANLAETHLRYHPLEAGALDAARSGTAKIIIDDLDLRPTQRGQTIAHGILQRAAFAVVQNLVSRRLPHVKERLALQMMRADFIRDHDRPSLSSRSGSCRHAAGSTVSSARSAPFVSPLAARTTSACRQSSAVLLRTCRSVVAHGGAPTSTSFDVASSSPRFWSRERIGTLQTEAFDGARRVSSTCRKSAASAASAVKSTWASAARHALVQADRSNIQAGTSNQRSASEALRLQRKTVPPNLSITA